METSSSWHIKPIVWIGAALVVLLIIAGSFWSWTNSIKNQGNTHQVKVVQQYRNYQNNLSTCLDNTRVGASIAEEEFAKVKEILTGAVSARYVDANGNSTNASAALGGGQFVSALAEQYPNIDTSTWKQLITIAVGCRNAAMGEANQLQHVAAQFNTWAATGGPIERLFREKYPTDDLKVTGLNGQVLEGQAALDFITQPVLTSDAAKAFETHTMPDQSQDLFGNK